MTDADIDYLAALIRDNTEEILAMANSVVNATWDAAMKVMAARPSMGDPHGLQAAFDAHNAALQMERHAQAIADGARGVADAMQREVAVRAVEQGASVH